MITGELYAGELYAGELYAGELYAGEVYAGDLYDCGRRDSNPHALRRQVLSLVCLPIPPLPRLDTPKIRE